MLRQVAPDLVSVQQPQTTALERLCFLGHPLDPELLEVQVAGEPPPETRDGCPGARRRVRALSEISWPLFALRGRFSGGERASHGSVNSEWAPVFTPAAAWDPWGAPA